MSTNHHRGKARKPAPTRSPAVHDTQPATGVKRFDAPAKKAETKVVLFSVGDKDFTGPKDISPSFRIKVMRTFEKRGEEVAVLEIMDYLLGDQYDELLDMDLPEEILTEIHTLAIAKVLGIPDAEIDSPN